MADEKKPEKAKKPSRMYSEGRTIGKGEDGKPKMVETKKADEKPKDATTAGAGAEVRDAEDRSDMHKRHKRELSDMHKRHEDEHAAMAKRHKGA